MEVIITEVKDIKKTTKVQKNKYLCCFLQGLSLQARYDLFTHPYNYFLRTSEVDTWKCHVK